MRKTMLTLLASGAAMLATASAQADTDTVGPFQVARAQATLTGGGTGTKELVRFPLRSREPDFRILLRKWAAGEPLCTETDLCACDIVVETSEDRLPWLTNGVGFEGPSDNLKPTRLLLGISDFHSLGDITGLSRDDIFHVTTKLGTDGEPGVAIRVNHAAVITLPDNGCFGGINVTYAAYKRFFDREVPE